MSRRISLIAAFFAALLTFVPLRLGAQVRPIYEHSRKPETFKFTRFKLLGSTEYSQDELLAAAGLHLGDIVTQDSLQEATNRVAATGVFSTVRFQFLGLVGGGVEVTIEVQPNAQMVPAVCDNCVWLSDAQIHDELSARLPLFHGKVPLGGDYRERVRDTLQQILLAHGIQTTVEIFDQGVLGRLPTAVYYRAAGVNVILDDIACTGVEQLPHSLLADALRPQIGSDFRRSYTMDAVDDLIRSAYTDHGYLGVQLGDPVTSIIEQSGTKTRVKLTVPIVEGIRYNYAGVTWTGNAVLSAEQLNQAVNLPRGEFVNLRAYTRMISGRAQPLYGTRGRLDVRFDVVPRLQGSDAVLDVTVHEGDTYTMGVVNMKGIDAPTAERLRSLWALKEGDVYDSSYPKRFSEEIAKALPPQGTWQWIVREVIDHASRKVDVVYEFRPKIGY